MLHVFDTVQLLLKAEDAARDSRKTKQDRYEEMRRRKDEERDAHERKLVSWYKCMTYFDSVGCHLFGIIYPGRRSTSSKSEGGRSCCVGV